MVEFRIGLPQSFDGVANLHKNEVGPKTAEVILNWAGTLPKSRGGIVDLAAGQGIEASMLAGKGYRVLGIEISDFMIQNSYHGEMIRGDLTNLKLRQNSYSGALLKDAWIFLPIEKRLKFLGAVKKALVKDGSLLIISQMSDTRAHLVPIGSRYPTKILRNDFRTYEEWIRNIEKQQNMGSNVFAIEYESEPNGIIELAKKVGFKASIEEYGYRSALSQENRWIEMSGFIAKLKK